MVCSREGRKKEECGITCTNETGYKKDSQGNDTALNLWEKMEEVCGEISCSICADSCRDFLQSQRDRIALHKGLPVHNRENLKKSVKDWHCTGKKLGMSL
tara:strand:+ start:1887 stop:2186 length:300 start_codon:yes stop_codon:yes gene_type:complete